MTQVRPPLAEILVAVACVSMPVALGAPAVSVGLGLDKAVYPPGDSVRFTLTLANSTAQEAVFDVPTSQLYDLTVLRGDQVIWRWSGGKAFLQVVTRTTLRPGETRTYEVVWDQRDAQGRLVPAGDYAAQGRILTREPLQTDRIPFRIGAAPDRATQPVIGVRSFERSGVALGEVLVNGRVVLRMREPAGGLSAVARAEIIAGRLRMLVQQDLKPQELEVATVGGEAAIVWRGQLLVTADVNHARLNRTTALALARLWRTQLLTALSP